MNKSTLLAFLAFSIAGGAFAQSTPLTEGPPNAEVGKCYAKCYIPNQYKEVTEQVLIRPAHKKLVVVPAVYESTTEQVLVKQASKRYEYVPATFETKTEQVLVKEASKKMVVSAATYESTTEQVLVSAKTDRWVKKNDPNCISSDPNDCIVLCLEEVPAQYKTVTSSAIKTPASVKEVEVPAEYTTIYTKTVKTPATTREIEVPAVHKTITKQVLKTPARVEEVEVPAEYKTVTKQELVKEGEYTDWREILCDSKVTNYTIRQIQQALIGKGYDVGNAGADNVMGKATRDALIKYQRDNDLPVGNLNIETLRSLGINY